MSDSEPIPSAAPLAALRHPATIRLRCAAITRAVADDVSLNFTIDRSRLDACAARVEAVIRRRFPDLRVPPHSRWRHFEAGGVDRRAELEALLEGRSAADRLRAMVDLTVVSVLLDAGAGARWRYVESRQGQRAAVHVGSFQSSMLAGFLSGHTRRARVSPARNAAR
jgi:hypothetical protein